MSRTDYIRNALHELRHAEHVGEAETTTKVVDQIVDYVARLEAIRAACEAAPPSQLPTLVVLALAAYR